MQKRIIPLSRPCLVQESLSLSLVFFLVYSSLCSLHLMFVLTVFVSRSSSGVLPFTIFASCSSSSVLPLTFFLSPSSSHVLPLALLGFYGFVLRLGFHLENKIAFGILSFRYVL
ncbi:hypothetical protein VNO80_30298 [Phaseolus coccineus]|uniref:Transmembrane protein n=1 Tax=Phaseolus coccineus TaxID=3886 RepID=A0AAN9LG71_PHACN